MLLWISGEDEFENVVFSGSLNSFYTYSEENNLALPSTSREGGRVFLFLSPFFRASSENKRSNLS